MANRARDWSSPRQAGASPLPSSPPPSRPQPFISSSERCLEHDAILHEFGWEGKYLCPQCMQHRWEEAHGSEFAWSEAFILRKLYGRNHRIKTKTTQDLRPYTAWTYRKLRTRTRAYAKIVLRIPGTALMDLEPLLPFVGATSAEIWTRLQAFDQRRVARKSP